jgi:spore coat protein A, manganese oxidase
VHHPVRSLARSFALLAVLVPSAPAAASSTTPLPIPPVLTGADITIPIQQAGVQILPGSPTQMWTFGGTFPGPTIRRPAGEATHVTFVNQLPAAAGSLTIHNHGAHTAAVDDGQPEETPGENLLIPTGGSRTYDYPLTENGGPERAAFQWYHDHRMDVTGRNVWDGLAGMFIIDDPVDAALPLPKGDYDVPLMIVDRSFDADNQLTYPAPVPFGTLGRTYPGTGEPPDDTITGDHLLVNGAYQPYLATAPRRYRLRLLNASNGEVFTFSLSNGQAMTQIATESGLLPAPVARTSVTLAPAERAEVVVDFGQEADLGQQISLLENGTTTAMEFHVGSTPVTDDASVPTTLRPVPDLGTPVRNRAFNLSLAEDPARGTRSAWAINGLTYDHGRVDAQPQIGTTETWTFSGASRIHAVHIHGTDFRVLSRDGAPPPAWEDGLKETVLVHPKETVVVELRFTDNLGTYVFHCHVLEHEDNGMMAQYQVTDGQDTPPPPPPPGDTTPPAPGPGAGDGPGSGPDVGPPASADLGLRWLSPVTRARPGARLTLRLEVRNKGLAESSPVSVAVAPPRGWQGKRTLRVAALAPAAKRVLKLHVRVAARPHAKATLVARLLGTQPGTHADDRAQLVYRRSHGKLRLAAQKAAAARAAARFICPLLAGA